MSIGLLFLVNAAECKFYQVSIDVSKTHFWLVAYESLKTKENHVWWSPKSVANRAGRLRDLVAYESLTITEFEGEFKRGFKILVVIGAGRLWDLVAYESLSLQSLSENSNGDSKSWSLLELVAYESGRS